MIIIMHNCSKHTFRTSHKYVLAYLGLFDKIFQEILISTATSKIVELFQYAVFHFGSSHVGKGYGQDICKIARTIRSYCHGNIF